MKRINVYCLNNNINKVYPLGITLEEIRRDLNVEMENQVCGALVNNRVKELNFVVVKSKRIRFIDYSHLDGRRLYVRSLLFLLYAAIREIMPDVKMKIPHGISQGFYCELQGLNRPVETGDINTLKEEMLRWVRKDVPFTRREFRTEDAINELTAQGLSEKAKLIEQQGTLFSYLYYLEDYANFFFGYHVPSTGLLTNFDIVPYYDGILLCVPKAGNFKELNVVEKEEKLFEIFREHKKRASLLQVPNLGMLNEAIMQGRGGDLIKISEALHEKKIAEIANMIDERKDSVKVVLIAGPSSSGKTTFCKRLSVQLAVNGIIPHMISLDDYFVDREKTPLDEQGNYDFEALGAVDISFFNSHLSKLFKGETIELPVFNFLLGKREPSGRMLSLGEGHILLIEGIHCMNPKLLTDVEEHNCFKVFLSALTQVSFDDQNHISTSDNRLFRRIIRDNSYRGYSASETIRRWPSVMAGEDKNIFPYQKNADIMFNSALIYELAVMKKYAEPLLETVQELAPEYCEAKRLLKFLSYFRTMDDQEIPPTSLIREFLGGSSFQY